jgi:hypothetical protein
VHHLILLQDEPEKFIQVVAIGVLEQSSILLNLIIIATGQETMLQLLQWRCVILFKDTCLEDTHRIVTLRLTHYLAIAKIHH